MIRRGLDNVILRCRELCQQFMVDMYAKIESERLRYLRYNQQKLRAEEYIHLRDAINNNADVAEIGNHVILPSSSVKSIKYICKYVHKGSDMAVFRVENTNVNAPPVNKNDEITLYQMVVHQLNEAAWRIFGFQFMNGIQQLFS
ncbi:hypothetical protein EVAR_100133_1 [Eumeta japonica]|uniref:Helitron helicase-like domain-containing protein n=1 Tax=Eumeta variegata TaxID=151549 RepID=A0A4C1TDC1_EUMVA|nr:hypothetical protein EVAR_100133_1 [Eumeta japonica]